MTSLTKPLIEMTARRKVSRQKKRVKTNDGTQSGNEKQKQQQKLRALTLTELRTSTTKL